MSPVDDKDIPADASAAAPVRALSPGALRYALTVRRSTLLHSRQRERERLLEQYDTEVFQPGMAALQAECEALGHVLRLSHTGADHAAWGICTVCGASAKLATTEAAKS